MSDKLCYSIADAATALSIGKSNLQKLLDKGDLKSFWLGHRRLVNREALDEFRLKLEQEHTKEIAINS